jgi:hypothetical protein
MYVNVLSLCELFAWVRVKDCFALVEINVVETAPAALAVIGVKRIIESGPDLRSVTTVVVAEAAKVKAP